MMKDHNSQKEVVGAAVLYRETKNTRSKMDIEIFLCLSDKRIEGPWQFLGGKGRKGGYERGADINEEGIKGTEFIQREVLEEASGLDIHDYPIHTKNFIYEDNERIIGHVFVDVGSTAIAVSAEIHEGKWFRVDQLDKEHICKNIMPAVASLLEILSTSNS